MTAPRIIPAVEARALLEAATAVEAQALLEAATPGSWSCEPPREVISLAVSRVLREGSYLVAEVVAEHASLVAAAPDLAASVVALHAEVDRAVAAERTKIVQYLRTRAEGCEAASWLKAEVGDELGPEDIVRHLLPEGADIASVKRAYEVGGVQFHRLGVDQKADPFLGQNEERDRLARAFESLLRLDQEVQHRAKAIFSANHLGDHGFSASVTFTYDPVRDKAK